MSQEIQNRGTSGPQNSTCEYVRPKKPLLFSTSDRFYQMCYCCRKLENLQNVGGRVRESPNFWEAMGGRAPWLDNTDLSESLSQSGSTASHRPLRNSDSLAHGLPHFVMWSVIRCAINPWFLVIIHLRDILRTSQSRFKTILTKCKSYTALSKSDVRNIYERLYL